MVLYAGNHHQPLHVRVAQEITRLIAAQYQPEQVLPTYKELAQRLKVSKQTIGKAMELLTLRGMVRPVRRKGTVVNRQVELSESPLLQVGLIIYCTVSLLFRMQFMARITESILGRIGSIDADCRIFSLHRSGRRITAQSVVDSGVDGVILIGINDTDYLRDFSRLRIPVVVVDHFEQDVPLDYVVGDNQACARTVVQALVEKGHRKITYFGTPRALDVKSPDGPLLPEESDARERREFLLTQAASAGLTICPPAQDLPRLRKPDMVAHETAVAEMIASIRAGDGPTAAVTYDEAVARRVLLQVLSAGLRIPEDLSIVALAAAAEGIAFENLPLSYCLVDFLAMGSAAMDLLEQRCHTARPPKANILRIPGRFVPGATLGWPRMHSIIPLHIPSQPPAGM